MNFFRRLFLLIIILPALFRISPVHAASDPADSLRRALDAAVDDRTRIGLLLDLTDLSAGAGENGVPYPYRLYDAARRAGDKFALAAALPSIVLDLMERSSAADSLSLYLDDAEAVLKGSVYDGVATYYRMTVRARELQAAAREDKAAICERLRTFYGSRAGSETPYERAERLFMNGVIAYQLLSMTAPDAITAGLPYWEAEWQEIRKFDKTTRRLFAGNLIGCLTLAYSEKGDAVKFVGVSDEYLALLDAYYADPEVCARRPFISKELSYLVCYQGLINGEALIGRERAHEYYLRYRDFVHSADDGSDPLMRDHLFYYTISQHHYDARGEYAAALAYCDSLIRQQERGEGIQRASMLSTYQSKASLLKRMGRFEEACTTYEQVARLTDSLSRQQYLDKVGEMEAKFGVEKLEAAMLADRRRNQLFLVLFILFACASAGVYLFCSLRRERRLRAELRLQSDRAQESDRLKAAFLNMVGHEVRTPLNVINGFVEVLLSGEVPEDQRAEYMELIGEHSRILLSLMSDMLQVADLDNTAAELPREPLAVNGLLREIAAQANFGNPAVACELDLPNEEIVVRTHAGYFPHVFRELVKNAQKFTEQGTITLGCRADRDSGEVVCTVTDTGKGIPAEKADYVFERFTQLDPFVQGTGLGLYLCRLILMKLGGTIRLDPSYTTGARFVVTIGPE